MPIYQKIKSKLFPNKNKLYQSLQIAWDDMGQKEPFYSVVTNDRYKMESFGQEQKKEFYFSEGSLELTRYVDTQLKKYLNSSLDTYKEEGIGLDFGCGVGRNTIHLAPHFKKFVGLDISKKHIEEAQKICIELKLDHVQFKKSHDHIVSFGMFDFIFTVITLQHIPPPLMKAYIDQLLQMLNPKGVAFLHLPTEAKGYRFLEQKYFFKKGKKLSWDMHILGESIVRKLIKKNNCRLVHLDQELDLCGGKWKSGIFMIQKQ